MSTAQKTGKQPESKSGKISIPSIRIPKAVEESLNAPVSCADFSGQGMTGAQIFAKLCKEEDLAALFCAAGNYHIVDEIAQVGIPCYGGRTEGGMCAAADGFCRVTGEIAATSGTEGPGITHMMMNIGSAHFANSALLVLVSNSFLSSEDTQSWIQFIYQQQLTEGLKKYGKRITVPNRIYEYGSYAFRKRIGSSSCMFQS
jgi:thiamine pyrophosphate-dependent acetolactate synthase large subunit-like protein